MANRHTDYISAVREANRQVWDGINTLKALQREWQALDYGNTLPDGEGGNEGYTSAEIGAVVFATTDALSALLDGGHATNMANAL